MREDLGHLESFPNLFDQMLSGSEEKSQSCPQFRVMRLPNLVDIWIGKYSYALNFHSGERNLHYNHYYEQHLKIIEMAKFGCQML